MDSQHFDIRGCGDVDQEIVVRVLKGVSQKSVGLCSRLGEAKPVGSRLWSRHRPGYARCFLHLLGRHRAHPVQIGVFRPPGLPELHILPADKQAC